MNICKYLAYGSNLHPQRLKRRVPSASFVGHAFLSDYGMCFHKRSYVDGSGKCSLVVGGSGVYVAIFDIANAEQEILDGIEGVGQGYEHHVIDVDGFGGCLTYIATPDAIDDSLLPMDWYREYVLRGARYHDFPDHYVANLENHRTVRDHDEARALKEWQTIRTLD